jgi:hypothetical protein
VRIEIRGESPPPPTNPWTKPKPPSFQIALKYQTWSWILLFLEYLKQKLDAFYTFVGALLDFIRNLTALVFLNSLRA